MSLSFTETVSLLTACGRDKVCRKDDLKEETFLSAIGTRQKENHHKKAIGRMLSVFDCFHLFSLIDHFLFRRSSFRLFNIRKWLLETLTNRRLVL